MKMAKVFSLSLLHLEQSKLYGVLVILSATGFRIGANPIGNEGKHKNGSVASRESIPIHLNHPVQTSRPTVHVLTEGRES